ncbi:hypothetical protein F4777DRAFT_355233 [Nemania sp. FL0916]|nr:hypothetical protein F4777DRAFT_355233 [Nemania sp. FL0916]
MSKQLRPKSSFESHSASFYIFVMGSGRHLQIINPMGRESKSFTLFPLLPTELRLAVWQMSLKHGRLITIGLDSDKGGSDDQAEAHPYTKRNILGNIISDAGYHSIVDEPKLLSKLLRVSREARGAALSFYRVHLPCYFKDGKGQEISSTLPINPEFDIIALKSKEGGRYCIDFIHDVRAYDVRGIGLLNLALGHNEVASLAAIKSQDLGLAAQTAFTKTLLNLHEVIIIAVENAGRRYLGVRGGISSNDRYEFHRSRPVMSAIPSFDRLALDPRDRMDRDLSRVFVGTHDFRKTLVDWLIVFARWKISYPPQQGPKCFLMISTGGSSNNDIVDRESAAEWLRKEDELWNAGQRREATRILKKGYQMPLETPEELEMCPQPAIGFWLFPIQALVRGSRSGSHRQGHRNVDMRRFRPQLCLTHMSS